MTSQEIRQQFIDFFKSKEHTFVRSSPVVPIDDPTLLFTNAGMNQFKPIFLNEIKTPYPRAANSQKCIRVSGKHNDLEEVGVDNYHHTFFEMLGNWSFGDYYKEDAIKWAWELLTEVWKLDKDRLWVTIYKDDDESGEIWKRITDINPVRVLKFGNKDNFWEMGETGPCGPCTEIHYYTGDNIEEQDAKGVNDLAEYREIWNLVFIQYNRETDGSLSDLPDKHVDTGAGFERLVAILNGKESNYETDLFIPILNQIESLSGKNLLFNDGVPHQVIADHLRMLSFSIADGALPSNEGRGYVLRRVLRRASRFGRMLGLKEPFIFKLINTLLTVMGDAFPELIDKQSHIEKVIKAEEISFGKTLDVGLEIFDKISKKSESTISGEDAFKLYDTYGFPLDLTELMAREIGLDVDSETFNLCMEAQRDRARSAGKFNLDLNSADWVQVSEEITTEFLGYSSFTSESKVVKYRLYSDNITEIILDKTPFYGESGGQIGDRGKLIAKNFEFTITDTQCKNDYIIHIGKVDSGELSKVKMVTATINSSRRKKIKLNHTATHLLHQALKDVLGNHVQQAGSLVAVDRLRFDLTHFQAISKHEIDKIENIVNSKIRSNIPLDIKIMDFDIAKKEGATALFGEKYDDDVRVVDIPGFSKELCGGTHVDRTGDIGSFKIISESALSSGVRRIEAVTGEAVQSFLNEKILTLDSLKENLKCAEDELIQRVHSLLTSKKELEKELKQIQSVSQGDMVNDLINSSEVYKGNKIIVKKVEGIIDLKALGDSFREQFKENGIALIGTINNGKPMVMCSVTDDLTYSVKAGDIVKLVGQAMDGGGGGKPHLATAGGKDISKLEVSLQSGKNKIIELLGN